MTADPRVEPGMRAALTEDRAGWDDETSYPLTVVGARHMAVAILTAADAADREQSIHRVCVDEEAVERVAREMAQQLGHGWAFEHDDSSKYATRQRFKNVVRAVLAVLIGDQKPGDET